MFRFMIDGKAREMGLGSCQDLSLAQARDAAAQCRLLLTEGKDPQQERERQRHQARLTQAQQITFQEAADRFMTAKHHEWKDGKHSQQWANTLATYVYPELGPLPVGAIDVTLVVKVLEPTWRDKTETASRVRGRIEQVFDWAIAHRYRSDDNPARWKGLLDKLLPTPGKIQRSSHHPSLPYANLPALFTKLRAEDASSAKALVFLILTAERTSEVLGASWQEIDFDKGLWIIPAGRMKPSKEHRVPLCATAPANA
nr:integrase arm-type DNA-binding domain-containing protein [Crenobacter cavernae]